jgi:hypothetical protein
VPIWRKPAWTRKSHTRLVLLTSTLTRSRASRRLSLPPRLAYSRTSVSLITRYGLGRIRSCEQSVCSAGVRRCNDGLLARLSGAAAHIMRLEPKVTEYTESLENVRGLRMAEALAPGLLGLGLSSLSWLFLASDSPAKECARRESETDD